MPGLKFRKKAMLIKIESVYGTDSVPTGAADAILVGNVDIQPFVSNPIERQNVQPYLGSRQSLQPDTHVVMEFDIELAGAGTAVDNPPGYGPVLRACALAETINAVVDVVYDPVETGEESVSAYFHQDGHKHAVLGVRGSVELRLNRQQVPVYHCTLMGLYVGPVALADPALTLTAFQKPLTVNNANTPTVTLHGFAAKLESFTLTQGNNVVHRDLPGEESVQITDRRSVGQIVIELPALGTKDFYAIAKAETLGALQIIHGTAAFNIVTIDAANVQILQPEMGESDGLVTMSSPLAFVPSSAGSDDFSITTT
ncbi:MAG: hypothetical protein FVQ79_00715 [Planctomycetes bacterium]|nr:hypothetical protein [Planctomycetota bacterium]